MFKLFQDTCKCGFSGKVKVKFLGQILKIAQKMQIALLSFVILAKCSKMERGIIYQNKLQYIGFN